MDCPKCGERQSPWIKVVRQLGTLGVVSFWWSLIISKWDAELPVLGAIFVTITSFAFLGDRAIEFAKSISPFSKGG